MDNEDSGLRGNLHAIEYMLGQLFVLALERHPDPQSWIKDNAETTRARIMRPNAFNEVEKETAYGTVRRVMETASNHFETDGRGPAVDLRAESSHPDKG